MAQPLKQVKLLSDEFSKELMLLITYIDNEFIRIHGANKITPEIFVYMSLEYKDSIFYKVINNFISDTEIEKIHDRIGNLIDYSSDLVGGKFDILRDTNFKNIIIQSLAEKNKTQSNLITSDHILLSILSTSVPQTVCNFFKEKEISYEKCLNACKELHGITTTVYKKSNENYNNQRQNKKNFFGKKIDFCSNLLYEIEYSNINKTFGLEKEISQIFTIFNRRDNNNVLIIGEKGVGKTQCVYGVAEKIYNGICPIEFQDKLLWKLNTTELYAGTSVRGSLEERIVRLSKQLTNKSDSILFIDDLFSLLGQKHSSGEGDFGAMFNTIFSNRNVRVICCCTHKELKTIKDNYRDIIHNFQEITINAQSKENCVKLLNNIKENYENFHNVKYSDEILHHVVSLSEEYITQKSLPLSAIEVIDEIGAEKKTHSQYNDAYINIIKNIKSLEEKKNIFVREDKIDDVNKINNEIEQKRNELSNILLKKNKRKLIITLDDVYKTFSEHTNIPVNKLTVNEKEKLKTIEAIFHKKIIGQTEAIDEITKAIKRNKVGLSESNAPRLTILCIGPSGVGKTMIAKTLAKDILGDEKYLVRFDMSEYSDETSVNKLIGSSAGYVGYTDGGLLTEAIKRNKYCVLLLDEIEKANTKVFNLFLQVLDEGFITDNMGQKVNFKNTYIIMTSNIGTKKALSHKSIGFNGDDEVKDKTNIIKREMKGVFPPEFLNRFDNIVFFNSLSNGDLKEIINLELSYLSERINSMGNKIDFSEKITDFILKQINQEKEFGARPIKRLIKNNIENQIADEIINSDCERFFFYIDVINEKIVVTQKK